MNIYEALKGIRYLLDHVVASDVEYIGGAALDVEEELRYIYEFARTIAPVPTDHDLRAEMESWDVFFEERKELANDKRTRI